MILRKTNCYEFSITDDFDMISDILLIRNYQK